MKQIKLGLVINPVAGIGGTVGLKGSDGSEIYEKAIARGATFLATEKTRLALHEVLLFKNDLMVYAAPGEMGAFLAKDMGFQTVEIGQIHHPTIKEDTKQVVKELAALPVDILLFAGGDGTARDICSVLSDSLMVIGVPAGVKIHSGVYANSPQSAGKALLAGLSSTMRTTLAEVMDIDEDAYRAGILSARLYGYLSIPVLHGMMQNPKASSHNNPNETGGLCHEIAERIEEENNSSILYIFGAGSTIAAVQKHLGIEASLLGIDVMQDRQLIAKDLTEAELLSLTKNCESRLIITAIGGQGHIFGRGNQQLSPTVIRQIGFKNIWVTATAAKIYALPNQCLYVDTGDVALDANLRGYLRVIVGYHDMLVCEVR